MHTAQAAAGDARAGDPATTDDEPHYDGQIVHSACHSCGHAGRAAAAAVGRLSSDAATSTLRNWRLAFLLTVHLSDLSIQLRVLLTTVQSPA